jgi:predicted permease
MPPRELRPDLVGRRGREIREEIAFHLDERARELEAQGLSPEEAKRRAAASFGDPERVTRDVLREWWESPSSLGGRMIAELWQDTKYALRTLAREPVFATATGVSLALAIGGNAAVFGIVDATLLRRPPVDDPETLVAVYTSCRNGEPRCTSSYPDYLDYRAVGGLVDLAATDRTAVSAALPGEPADLLDALTVTGNYFGMLGVTPAVGRLLQPSDDTPGATSPVVVLSHDAWRTRFGLDPAVLGSTLRLNGVPYEVVGVAPDGFRGMSLGDDPDLFLPLTSLELLSGDPDASELWEDRGSRWITQLVGRRQPGMTLQGLREEMDALSQGLDQAYPDLRGQRFTTVDASPRYSLPTSTSGRNGLTGLMTVLAGVVILNLLLAAANVANLLLARGATRGSEMGVRLALGSSGSRLVRQLLAESVTLALFGGVMGLGVALLILRALSGFDLPGGVPLAQLGVGIDGKVFAFALALSLATGVSFGVVPALRAGRRDPSASLGAGARASRREGDRLRRALVATQVCACVILLAGAGLFLRGLKSGLDYDIGMEPSGLALARFDFSLLRYSPEEAMQRVDEILTRARALPGVESAAVSTTVPLVPGRNMGFFVQVDGYQPAAGEEMRVEMAFATEGFFRTLGTEVVSGGDLESGAAAGDPVLVVNRLMAEAYWDEGRVVDGTVRWRDQPLRVVGVAENSAWRSVPQQPLNLITASLRQHASFASNGTLTLLVRGLRPESLLDPMRSAILSVDPNLTVESVRTMEDVMGSHLSAQRMGSLLLVLFGGQALVLAFVGIGGVVAYVVSRQKKELGIRIALGASRSSIQSRALLGLAFPVTLGLAAGLVIATRLGTRVQAFLVEANAADFSTYGAAAALLALVAAVAAWIPARAAARVDPVRVLKAE